MFLTIESGKKRRKKRREKNTLASKIEYIKKTQIEMGREYAVERKVVRYQRKVCRYFDAAAAAVRTDCGLNRFYLL